MTPGRYRIAVTQSALEVELRCTPVPVHWWQCALMTTVPGSSAGGRHVDADPLLSEHHPSTMPGSQVIRQKVTCTGAAKLCGIRGVADRGGGDNGVRPTADGQSTQRDGKPHFLPVVQGAPLSAVKMIAMEKFVFQFSVFALFEFARAYSTVQSSWHTAAHMLCPASADRTALPR